MYKLTLDGNLLHNSDYDDYVVVNPVLKLAANKLATLTFTIYDNNPQYNNIRKLKSKIAVYRDNEIIALVRPVKSKLNFQGGIDYTCEDCLARLNDIKCRPGYFRGTQAEYITAMLNKFMKEYAAQFEPEHMNHTMQLGDAFLGVRELQAALTRVGYGEIIGSTGIDGYYGTSTKNAEEAFEADNNLTVNGVFDLGTDHPVLMQLLESYPLTPPDIIFSAGSMPRSGSSTKLFTNLEYLGYWDLLQKNVVDAYGGYLIPSYTENTITLDYKGDANLTLNEQKIRFGENLSDLFLETDADKTFSVVVPVGADTYAQIPIGTTVVIPYKLNDNGIDYIESKAGIELYGRREVVYNVGDTYDYDVIKARGQAYLDANAIKLKEKLSLSVYDLKYANINMDYFSFLDKVEVISVIHGITQTYPLTEMQITLNQPTASKITLGAETYTLTDKITSNQNDTNTRFSGINARVYNLENPDNSEEES